MFLFKRIHTVFIIFAFVGSYNSCMAGFSKNAKFVIDHYLDKAAQSLDNFLTQHPRLKQYIPTAQLGHKYSLLLFNDLCLNLPHSVVPHYQYLQYGVANVDQKTQSILIEKLQINGVKDAHLLTIKKMYEYLRDHADYEIIKVTNWTLFVDEIPFNQIYVECPAAADILLGSVARLLLNQSGQKITLYKTISMLCGYGLLYKSSMLFNLVKQHVPELVTDFYFRVTNNSVIRFFKPLLSVVPSLVNATISLSIAKKEEEEQKIADQQSVDKTKVITAVETLHSVYQWLKNKKISTDKVDKRIQWLIAYHNSLVRKKSI